MEVMCRHAADDFIAMMTAQGMEDAGASVFSIVYTGERGVLSYVIYCKFDKRTHIDAIDKAIASRLLG
jgi:hypothetical protein